MTMRTLIYFSLSIFNFSLWHQILSIYWKWITNLSLNVSFKEVFNFFKLNILVKEDNDFLKITR